jgi:hypothetical protein
MSIFKKNKYNVDAVADFKKLATKNNSLFVDKTSFIKEIIDSSQKSMLITYPEGWGKTLNLNMLKVFFELENGDCRREQSVTVDNSWFSQFFWWWKKSDHEMIGKNVTCNKDIFEPLFINTVDSGKYMKYQGSYPVLYVSLGNIVERSFVAVEKKLKDLIKSLYEEHSYLADSDKLHDDQKIDFKRYVNKDYSGNFYLFTLKESLTFLSKLLFMHYGKKVYVLVDDYDAPVKFLFLDNIGKLYKDNAVINQIASLISGTVCATVRNNEYIEKVILTGTFDPTVIEYDMGCSSIMTYSISDQYFSKSFGFSDEEINKLVTRLSPINREKTINFIKDLYGGYIVPADSQEHKSISSATIKHLKSIKYLKHTRENQGYLKFDYKDTLLPTLLVTGVDKNNNFSEKLLGIAQHGSVQMNFKNYVSLFDYDWLDELGNELFFSYLLLNTGLFTAQKVNSQYQFSIPNKSSLQEFLSVLKGSKYEGSKYKKIVYELQKFDQLKIFKLIEKKDEDSAIEKLQEEKVVCEENAMNFNFFHSAAVFNLKNVFTELLRAECAGNLYFANDKIAHLKPVDYAFLFKNNDILYKIQEYHQNNNQKSINILELRGTIFCYMVAENITTTSVASGFSHDIVNNDNVEKNCHIKLIVDIFKHVTQSYAESEIKNQCTEHSDYKEIDISNPSTFSSLKQFEKYLLHNENAQVVVNEDCSDKQKKLSELTYPIFNNSLHSDMELKFTLCNDYIKDEFEF